ncbi:recombinase family protein [Cellulomonas triticagri]|uniref:recombinase family protein n=1 Tax=Cellulomonas triticagri TaxID=2483352 RepID=UPI0013159870|nr:recombinase family protein [Cellulomonas triticagri]
MLADIRAGRVDAVVCWHIDRLHRQPIELEEFAATCTSAGVSDVVTLHGDLNLGSGDGLLVARLLAAVAANESDAKSRRSQRKMLELAQSGRAHSGGWRPFGFATDRVTHDPREADAIRTVAARVIAGESLTSLCTWLDTQGITTVAGGSWRLPTLRDLLLSGRVWGQRTHRGQLIGPGQ